MTSGKTTAAGEVRGTSTKLVPRKGATPAWRAELADLLASYELTSVASEKNPPELDAIRQQAAAFPAAAIALVHGQGSVGCHTAVEENNYNDITDDILHCTQSLYGDR